MLVQMTKPILYAYAHMHAFTHSTVAAYNNIFVLSYEQYYEIM